jgi:hypothetical protein
MSIQDIQNHLPILENMITLNTYDGSSVKRTAQAN